MVAVIRWSHIFDLNCAHDPCATKNQSMSAINNGATIAISFVPVENAANAKNSKVSMMRAMSDDERLMSKKQRAILRVNNAESPSSCP